MANKFENEITEILDSYRQYDDEYRKIVKIMNNQSASTTPESASSYWSERRQNDSLRQFQDVVEKRCQLGWEMQEHYKKKIRAAKKNRSFLLAALRAAFAKLRWRK